MPESLGTPTEVTLNAEPLYPGETWDSITENPVYGTTWDGVTETWDDLGSDGIIISLS